MMNGAKLLFVRFLRDTIVGGRAYAAGDVAPVDPESYRTLMREGLACPAVRPTAPSEVRQIRPFIDGEES